MAIIKINSLGLRPKPPPKGKKVKIQKLRYPQEAEAQAVVPIAGPVPAAICRTTVPSVTEPAAAAPHPVRTA